MPTDYEREQFLKDTKRHELKVLLDHGLYKHLRFKNPESNCYYFDITTWPGFLCISGDMGSYTFSHTENILNLFQNKDGMLNIYPYSWGKKLQTGCDRSKVITVWSQEKFYKNVREFLNEKLSRLTLTEAKRSAKNVHENILSCLDEWESVEAIRNFEDDNIDFCDFFECDCTEYDYQYLWCCYAIVWGIQQYNKSQDFNLNTLRDKCHSDAKNWWLDLTTGQDLTIPNDDGSHKFNVPEKLCLIHSEISEAMEGYRKNLNDDHLSDMKMIDVELADAIIRIMDLCGALKIDINKAVTEKLLYNSKRADHKIENRLKDNGKKF